MKEKHIGYLNRECTISDVCAQFNLITCGREGSIHKKNLARTLIEKFNDLDEEKALELIERANISWNERGWSFMKSKCSHCGRSMK